MSMNAIRVCGSLFVSILLLSSISTATNFYQRHGSNFIYLDSSGAGQFDTLTYAPVIWDLRSASYDLTNYYISYGWETTENCDSTLNAITLLMQEACSHGVNTANVRGEIQRMTLSQLSTPDTSDLFVRIAEVVREDSLHLIAGGFWTDTDTSACDHNDAVVTYLDMYSDSTSGIESLIGDFIAVFGFDEPDARYEGPSWENCEYNTEWYDLVEKYADSSRSNISADIKPFGTFLVFQRVASW